MQFPLITAFCSRHWFSKITLSYRLGSVAGGRGISYRVVGGRLLILFHFPVLLKEHCVFLPFFTKLDLKILPGLTLLCDAVLHGTATSGHLQAPLQYF